MFTRLSTLVFALFVATCLPAWSAERDDAMKPHVAGGDAVARGRYLVIVGGCNDCHTQDFLLTEGKVPEEKWLAGNIVGWRGPWGTTYPPNLRLRVQEMTEEAWVEQLRTRTALPPMPWMNLNHMDPRDSAAIYQYIRSLGPTGGHMPPARSGTDDALHESVPAKPAAHGVRLATRIERSTPCA